MPRSRGQSLHESLSKYVAWTKAVVKTIRALDPHRIIILGSPWKSGKLPIIDLSTTLTQPIFPSLQWKGECNYWAGVGGVGCSLSSKFLVRGWKLF